MTLNEVKTPYDLLEFMKEHIKYGYVGIDGKKRIGNLDGFRINYRTIGAMDILKSGLGTCVEQVNFMKEVLDNLGIESKKFCTRMYEDESFSDLYAAERMHCFLLFYINGEVYQIEHPDPDRVGIHKYDSEEDAISFSQKRYEKMTEEDYEEKNLPIPEKGFARITTEYFDVPEGLTYKEFNLYVNSLDSYKKNI